MHGSALLCANSSYEETAMNFNCPPHIRIATGLLGTLLCVASTMTLAAAALVLPPIVQPPSAEHHAGKIIWVDLVTPNLATAEKFYTGLFGWSFQDLHSGSRNFAVAMLEGRPVAGIFEGSAPSSAQRQSAWLTFIAGDVAAAKRITVAHGGKVLFEPHVYAQRGRQAVFADPQGAVFAVLASSSGDPPDLLPAPGEWIWSSLITTAVS